MTEAARAQFLWLVAGVTAVLLLASIVSRVLLARAGGAHGPTLLNLDARIRSWWGIVALLSVSILIGAPAVIALFTLVSALALGEFIAHAPAPVRDPVLDAGCYALVALQYALIAAGNQHLALVALPIAAALVLPLAAVASGGTRELQARVAHRFWWALLAGWCLSFVPALLLLDAPALRGRELLFVAWLIIVTQGSDVLQYIFGKLCGRRAIAPSISPDKTVEGFVGGVVGASAIGTALASLTPFDAWLALPVAVLVTLLGFLGGLLLSGIKRDLGIKDWGHSISGHGGVLDRVDSLCLSAPALFCVAYALPRS